MIKVIKTKIIGWKNQFHYWLCTISWKFIQTSEIKIPPFDSTLPDLCPTSFAEGVDSYENRLTELLSYHNDVTEIAITSPYSGGKSSLLQTYQRKHPYHKYTNISLADFSNDENQNNEYGDNKPESRGEQESQDEKQKFNILLNVEKSIVQQLLYRVRDSDMPNSRFRKIVINKQKWHWYLAQPSGVLLWVLALTMSVFPNSSLGSKLLLSLNVLDIKQFTLLFSFQYIWLFPCLLIRDLYKYLNKFNISRLNLIKGEVTLDSKVNESIFNLYLEEIIYFFAATKSNIVIFEDLDRFGKPEIFVKLKEINKIINDSEEVEQNVRFIYALKDDVFKRADRTKFFDAIIPIIPITNSVNSYPQLKKLLEESNLLEGIKDEFIRDVAIYIEDMRMLKNIVAEYGIYKLTLSESLNRPEYHKLLSFIIYKNVYCDDFAALQENKGLLAGFINYKSELQKMVSKGCTEEIAMLENEILDIESEELRNIEELNAVFLIALLKSIQLNVWQIANHNITEVTKKEIFEGLWERDQNIQYRHGQGYGGHMESFKYYDNHITPSYSKRKSMILHKNNFKVVNLKGKIKELQERKKIILSASVKELISHLTKEEVFKQFRKSILESEDFNQEHFRLLSHLLEKGYVDEMYHHYISHFLEGDLTKEDMSFVLAVKSDEPFECNRALNNKVEIFKYLNSGDYHNEAVFNYDFINYLLQIEELDFVKQIILMINNSSSLNELSLFQSLDYIIDKKTWLNNICKIWNEFPLQVISSSLLNEEEKVIFLFSILVNLYDEENDEVELPDNEITVLSDYISQLDNIEPFLPNNDEYEQLISVLICISVKFFNLSTKITHKTFVQNIIENELFEVNELNYRFLYAFIESKEVNETNLLFSSFYRAKEGMLSDSIDNNINQFVSNILINGQIKIGDEGHCLLLFNNSDLKHDLKIELIEQNDFIINDISELAYKELWPKLLNENKLAISWKNLSEIMKVKDELHQELIEYISNDSVIENLKDQADSVKDLGSELPKFVSLLLESSISLETFSKYSSIFGSYLSELDYSDISTGKIEVLIEEQYIKYDEKTYESLCDSHPESIIHLIEYNYEDVMKSDVFDDLSFSVSELNILLDSDLIKAKHKKTLLSKLDESTESISVDLFNNYFKLVVSNDNVELPIYILSLFTSSKSILLLRRIHILATQISFMDEIEIFEQIKFLDWPYSKLANTKTNTSIPNNKESLILATELENKALFSISESSKLRSNLRLYRINR